MCFFYSKNSRTGSRKTFVTQKWLVVKSFLKTFLILNRFVYNIPSHLNDLTLVWSAQLQLCQKGQPPKFKASVQIFLIYEKGSEFNFFFKTYW